MGITHHVASLSVKHSEIQKRSMELTGYNVLVPVLLLVLLVLAIKTVIQGLQILQVLLQSDRNRK